MAGRDGTGSRGMSRRDVVKVLGVGTVGAGLVAGFPRKGTAAVRTTPLVPDGPPAPAEPRVRPFSLNDVELLAGPFRDARERDAEYMLSLDPDRLLANFRTNAGLEPRKPVYAGWESQQPWVNIRCHGHTAGHWLTAGSLLYAATGDARIKERLDYLVNELAACQRAGGTGFIGAFPDGAEELERAVAGERFVGVPWYTMHKIYAGLRDAYLLADIEEARPVLVALTDWAVRLTRGMSHAEFQEMLDREHGGMNEVLADIYVITGDERHLALARSFCHEALLEPLARGRDTLNGLHSNTQIPKVVGFQRLYELTRAEEYGAAARFFWETVVRTRSFATGTHGDVEHFFPIDEFPRHLGSAKTAETCCSYNMLRLTRMLFGAEPTADYGDYYERVLYNAILASQDPDSGWNTYFQATRPGYLKLYHTPYDSFWCCTGSGMENHAKYGDSIYFHNDDAVWVNLFIPSTLAWRDRGLTLRQDTAFPDEEEIRLTVASGTARATIHVRYPGWSGPATVTVNGEAVQVDRAPGSYIPLEREWRAGDEIRVRFPMSLRTEALPGEPDRVAFLYGPVVLAGRLGTEGLWPGADILRNERTSGEILEVPMEIPVLRGTPAGVVERMRRIPGETLTFRTDGIGEPRDVTLIPYHRLHHERYTLYWKLEA